MAASCHPCSLCCQCLHVDYVLFHVQALHHSHTPNPIVKWKVCEGPWLSHVHKDMLVHPSTVHRTLTYYKCTVLTQLDLVVHSCLTIILLGPSRLRKTPNLALSEKMIAEYVSCWPTKVAPASHRQATRLKAILLATY